MQSLFRRIWYFISHPTIYRWLDLAFLTIISLFVIKVLDPEVHALSQVFANRSQSWSGIINFLFLTLLSCLVALVLTRLGALSVGHFSFRRFIGFPPIWVSSIVAALGLIVLQDKSFYETFRMPPDMLFPWMLRWMGPFVLGTALVVLSERKSTQHPMAGSSEGVTDQIRNGQPLSSWLHEEKPIHSPSEDLFDFAVIARRIVAILRAEPMRAVGIIGPYGTGKTSLLNLTEYYLNQASLSGESPELFVGRIVVCWVDGWGRVRGSIAERVLAIALEELKALVDCSSIISLPAKYKRAIGGIRWPGGPVLEALLETSHDPVTQIKKLDSILTAARLRLVILLEDLDRNTADEIIRDEIPALLDRLRGMHNISFVMAIGTEHQYSNILIRICDYVESIA